MSMSFHDLKIEPIYLRPLLEGTKTFELRFNDRGYQKGDVLKFHRWNAEYDIALVNEYFGGQDFVQFEVTYVHAGLGLEKNWVALAVKRIE